MTEDTTKRRLFLIDTDAGLDDANAIIMALSQADIEVVAITATHGNVNVHQVTKNVLRLLKAAGKPHVPVYKGANVSLLGSVGDASFFHGKDGMGDVPDPNAPDHSLVQKEHAVTAMIRLVEKYKGEVTLVALGPLTNVALALRLDPEFGQKLKSCFIMGGNYKGIGNVTPSAEYNFHTDPEAAHIVLQELRCPITIACWELSVKHRLPLEVYDELRSTSSELNKFMKNVEKLNMDRKRNIMDYFHPCDELATACAIDNNCIQKSENHHVFVECHGQHTRGLMIIDHKNIDKKPENVRVVKKLNTELYVALLRAAVS